MADDQLHNPGRFSHVGLHFLAHVGLRIRVQSVKGDRRAWRQTPEQMPEDGLSGRDYQFEVDWPAMYFTQTDRSLRHCVAMNPC